MSEEAPSDPPSTQGESYDFPPITHGPQVSPQDTLPTLQTQYVSVPKLPVPPSNRRISIQTLPSAVTTRPIRTQELLTPVHSLQPSIEESPPTIHSRRVSNQDTPPVTYGRRISNQDPPPATHGRRVSIQEPRRVSIQEPLPTTHGRRVSIQEPIPTAHGSQVSIEEPPPTTRTRRVSIQEPPPAIRTRRVSIQEPPPATYGRRLSIQGPPPATYGRRLSIQGPPPTIPTRRLSIQESPPAAHTHRLSIQESPPAAHTPQLSIPESPPAAHTPRLSIPESPPAAHTPRLSIQESPPAVQSRHPSIQESPSTVQSRHPSIQKSPPAIQSRHPSIPKSPTLQSRHPSIPKSPTLQSRHPSIPKSPTLQSRHPSIQKTPTVPSHRLSVQESPPVKDIHSASQISQANIRQTKTQTPGLTNKQTWPHAHVPPSITQSPTASIDSLESVNWSSQVTPKENGLSSQLDQSIPIGTPTFLIGSSTGINSSRFQKSSSRQIRLPICWRLLHEARKISRQLSLVLTLVGLVIIGLICLGQPWVHFQVPLRPPGDPAGTPTIPINTILFVRCSDMSCLKEYDQYAYLLDLAWTFLFFSSITSFCLCVALVLLLFFTSSNLPVLDFVLFIGSIMTGASIALGVLFYLWQADRYLQEGMTYKLGISFYLAWIGIFLFLMTGFFSYLNYMNFWSILALHAVWT
ncbi:PREDICTED: extensin-like isoform X2 [Chinchilla lanigera]|uniref:extensin-like isoform X2 n=1 Tax=Chinchilla lanigera TaxID=34839 RepID=UPI000696EAEC|nr:PREDICTED: extensin-like isoform X2 [Chinchilla lanigera]